MKEKERGDEPGTLVAVGDTVRFFHGKRLLKGKVTAASDETIGVETESGRLYNIFRTDVFEIEAWAASSSGWDNVT